MIKTFVCVPVESFWDPEVEPIRCLNQPKAFISDLSLAILTDVIILVIPILLTWRITSMPPAKKLKIAAMLSAGGVALGATCWRMYLLAGYMTTVDISSGFVYLDVTV